METANCSGSVLNLLVIHIFALPVGITGGSPGFGGCLPGLVLTGWVAIGGKDPYQEPQHIVQAHYKNDGTQKIQDHALKSTKNPPGPYRLR